jgi:hypothetical protein
VSLVNFNESPAHGFIESGAHNRGINVPQSSIFGFIVEGGSISVPEPPGTPGLYTYLRCYTPQFSGGAQAFETYSGNASGSLIYSYYVSTPAKAIKIQCIGGTYNIIYVGGSFNLISAGTGISYPVSTATLESGIMVSSVVMAGDAAANGPFYIQFTFSNVAYPNYNGISGAIYPSNPIPPESFP